MENSFSEWNNYEQEFMQYAALYRETSQMSDAFRAISAGKAAIDWMKTLSEYATGVKDVQKHGELMRIIGGLSLELAEIEIRLAEQIKENQQLKEVIAELKAEASQPKLIFKNGLYYAPEDNIPFCPSCFEDKKKRIHLKTFSNSLQLPGYRCPICENIFPVTD